MPYIWRSRTEMEALSWKEWEAPLRDRDEAALSKAGEELAEEIDFYRFQQYEF